MVRITTNTMRFYFHHSQAPTYLRYLRVVSGGREHSHVLKAKYSSDPAIITPYLLVQVLCVLTSASFIIGSTRALTQQCQETQDYRHKV